MTSEPTFGRYREQPLPDMDADARQAYDEIVAMRGMIPPPYKILLSNPRVARLLNPLGAHFNKQGSSLTPAEREIVIVLVCAKWMAAFPARVHETFAIEAGLEPHQVTALGSGIFTQFTDEREQVIYSLAVTLLTPGTVSNHLFDQAVNLIGHEGIADVIALIGYYCTVALTLSAYDVPVGAEGLNRP